MKSPTRFRILYRTLHEVVTTVPFGSQSGKRSLCDKCLGSLRQEANPTLHHAGSLRQTGAGASIPRRSSKLFRHTRHLATVSTGTNLFFPDPWPWVLDKKLIPTSANSDSRGPLDEYDNRVRSHQLRDDEHQRGATC